VTAATAMIITAASDDAFNTSTSRRLLGWWLLGWWLLRWWLLRWWLLGAAGCRPACPSRSVRRRRARPGSARGVTAPFQRVGEGLLTRGGIRSRLAR
jgi:hypothetical protein